MAKSKLKNNFVLIPVHRTDWNLLGYFFDGQYYFDTVLPFWLRSSVALVSQLADISKWALKSYL